MAMCRPESVVATLDEPTWSPTTAAPLAPLPLYNQHAPPGSAAITLGLGASIDSFDARQQLELLEQLASLYGFPIERIKLTQIQAASVLIDLLLLPPAGSDPFALPPSTVADRIVADVAARSFGWKFGYARACARTHAPTRTHMDMDALTHERAGTRTHTYT